MDCFNYCGYDNLPNLPGNQFEDQVFDYRKVQQFDWVNGYAIPTECHRGEPQTVQDCLIGSCRYDPRETYGEPRGKPLPPFVPKFAKYEKQVLKFFAFYREVAKNSQHNEFYRVRPVEIFYYMEDDTITVYEPEIENTGLVHGTLVKRSAIPKNDLGHTWHWMDLNLGCDIKLFERVYRITDANAWTKEFYQSEGIILNSPEEVPVDPYLNKRLSNQLDQPSGLLNNIDDSEFFKPSILLKEKDLDKILTYNCVWDEGNEASLDYEPLPLYCRRFEIFYRLADKTVDVKQVIVPNSGQEQYDLLLKEIKLPKDYRDIPKDFPSIVMTPTEKEIIEYYTHEDFKIGSTINVYGRKFLIYDMDQSTKDFYREYYGDTEMDPICMPFNCDQNNNRKIMIPPWNGWGSPEDSLRNCLSIRPQAPIFVENVKLMDYGLKSLQFGAIIDSTRPEDYGRQFVISYRIMNDKVAVYESEVHNSGWPAGKFLDFISLQKPGSSNDRPLYYRPHDFYIGASIEVYGTRFILTSADSFVEEYMEENPELYPEEVKDNLREYFECERENAKCIEAEKKVCEIKYPNEEAEKEEEIDPYDCDHEGMFAFLGLGMEKSTCSVENYDNFRGTGYDDEEEDDD